MMKRIMTAITILATLTLTGCSLNNEVSPFIPVEAAGNDSSITSTVSEAEESTNYTSEVENETSINTSKPVESTTSSTQSKPEEKPVESSSTTSVKPVEKPVASTSSTTSKVENPVSSSTSTSTKPVEKPASSSTSSKVEKPVASSSSTTSKPVEKPVSSSTSSTTSKPVEKPVASSSTYTSSTKPTEKPVHNCATDGHVWEVTTTTTEPKWCREMHNVLDFGFDTTLAERYLNLHEDTSKIFKKTCKENGVSGVCGSATIDVEVWGTETFETKECKVCGHVVDSSAIRTITPIGEWRYINGQNPRCSVNDLYNFNTLFYDPYNVPQEVIDNIRIYEAL